MHLGIEPTDEEMLRFVENWIDLLSAGDYDAAFQFTAHDPYYGWTPELLRLVIHGYGMPEAHPSGTVFHVTPRHLALGGPPTRSIERYDDASPRYLRVAYGLPLNGEWSDLTATFRVARCAGTSVVTLEEIHVF